MVDCRGLTARTEIASQCLLTIKYRRPTTVKASVTSRRVRDRAFTAHGQRRGTRTRPVEPFDGHRERLGPDEHLVIADTVPSRR